MELQRQVASIRATSDKIWEERRSGESLTIFGLSDEVRTLTDFEKTIDEFPPAEKTVLTAAKPCEFKLVKARNTTVSRSMNIHVVRFERFNANAKSIFTTKMNAAFVSKGLGYKRSQGYYERKVYEALKSKTRGVDPTVSWKFGAVMVSSNISDFWFDATDKEVKPMTVERSSPKQSTSCFMVEMFRYAGPVNPAIFPHLAITLLTIGTFFATWFFVYEVTSNKYTRQLKKELCISLVSAIFLGFGSLFLCNWVGIYI